MSRAAVIGAREDGTGAVHSKAKTAGPVAGVMPPVARSEEDE